ncbi:putative hydrolase of the HAD superfamily [Granulicella rosea]|uniref:Putative hydrolase of the HAD superfamily n=1 Tax=Granulicella rosea TaxID=474952 RepID=A0A239HAE5_9BACT|nr:HAD family phosphatase [Granulicella rosea]SNS78111.1 putative hydrolase of the HAD superfamily [Granulicella rosea]
MSSVHAVLFDYGLVLCGPPDPAAWARMRAITGFDEPTLQKAYWTPRHEYDRGTYTGQGFWLEAGRIGGVALSDAQVEELIEADTDLWTQPNQPMIDWAARLQAAGVKTGILSNIGDAMEIGVRARMPWLAAFAHHTFSHNLKLAKPEQAIYRHAAEGLRTAPEHILFIDDKPENVAAAHEAGMQALQYTDHAVFLRELATLDPANLWTS